MTSACHWRLDTASASNPMNSRVFRCKGVSVVLPPAALGGILGKLKQTAAERIFNAVEVEQFLNFGRWDALMSRFRTADLSGRPADAPRDLAPGAVAAQSTQLGC